MSSFYLKLHAVYLEKNINRDYEILASQVLFGFWNVTLAFGRHGARGTHKNHFFQTKAQAIAFVQKTLQKRLKAPKRIGCAYVLKDLKVSKGENRDSWMTTDQKKVLTPSSPFSF